MKLIIDDLSKKFEKQTVFENVNFEIESGDIAALIGRNGSGKTTLMQTIVTILNKDEGKVYVQYDEGDDPEEHYKKIKKVDLDNSPEVLREIVYIPDRFDYFKNYDIKKVMKFYKTIYPEFDEDYCMDRINEFEIDNKKNLGSYSKGQLTIVGTIIGISTNAEFLLIDEPYDGIDIINSKIMDRLIIEASERNIGIFISSHQLDRLEKLANKILFLEEGSNVNTYEGTEEANIRKIQIVSSEEISENILENKDILVIQNIGRVATILYGGSLKGLEELFEDEKIVQHDELKVNVEDIFLWNSRKDRENNSGRELL